MNKDLNDYLTKFNSSEIVMPNEYLTLLNFISYETELSSKFYKVLDSLQIKLTKNPKDIETNFLAFSNFFACQCRTKNRNIFEFLINWLINIFYKIEENENLILKICFENIFLPNVIVQHNEALTLIRKSEIEENFLIKILKQKYEISESFSKIAYIHDLIEKKTGSFLNEKLKDNLASEKIKQKNKNILENLMKTFDRSVLDFYLVLISIKIKNKMNFDIERQNFKICCRNLNYDKIFEYFYEIMWYPFYFNPNQKSENQNCSAFLVTFLILFKSMGTKISSEFLNYITLKIKNFSHFSQFLINCDFGILSDSGIFSFQNYDTSIGHSKLIENFLFENTTSSNLKFDEKSEMNENKVIDKLKVLKNLIFFFENLIQAITKNQTILANKINLTSIYTFYYSLQLRLIKNFVTFFDSNKKLYYENQVKIGNLTNLLPKYNKKYSELNSIISEILSIFYWKENVSLIFQNWLLFIYKNTTILDSYKALRIFLLTKKEGGQIYTLLKMNSEIYKFFPCLWKNVLNSFLIDSSNRNSEENYNLITNLKFIFYYEISENSLRNSGANSSNNPSNPFYNSLSYDCNVILKFFREKFSVLTSIFFSDENIIEGILKKKVDKNSDMDVCFETYITGKGYKEFNTEEIFFENSQNSHLKTKIEILNILSFLLNTYSDTEIINIGIKKFILDLIDILSERRENSEILNHIADVFKIIVRTYKKNCGNQKIHFNPSKIIFVTLIKHLLNKILVQDKNQQRRNYFEYFLEIYENLNKNERKDMKNCIISTVKELVYKNVDNQSFKNPFTLKNMQGLNDIDEKICTKEYLMDLLALLDVGSDHHSFYGFYLRFLKYCMDSIKLITSNERYYQCKINLKKLLGILLKEKWIPAYYRNLVDAVCRMNEKNCEKFIHHVSNYLKDFPPKDSNQMEVEEERIQQGEKVENIEDYYKKRERYKILFKVMLIDNIQIINF